MNRKVEKAEHGRWADTQAPEQREKPRLDGHVDLAVAEFRTMDALLRWVARGRGERKLTAGPKSSLEFRPEIDFCVWSLVHDGLRVPPFGAHSPGRGELVAAGMSSELWSRWLANVVATFEAISDLLESEDDPRATEAEHFEELARSLEYPHLLVDGASPLRALLGDWWRRYRAERPSHSRWPLVPLGERMMRRATPRRLNGLHVYVVEYPAPSVMRVGSNSLVGGWDFSEDSVEAVVTGLEAAVARERVWAR